MLHFYSLMTFLQSNLKQAWNRDHNIGLFVIFIRPAALTWLLFALPIAVIPVLSSASVTFTCV